MADANDNGKNPVVLRCRVDQAKAGLEIAEAGFDKASAELSQAQADWDRVDHLRKTMPGAVSAKEYDQANYCLAAAKADAKKAQGEIDLAKANLAEAEVLLGDAH